MTKFCWVAVANVVSCLCFSIPAVAQCQTGAREFASIGGMGTQKLRIDTGGADNMGREFGRFWDPANSNLGNNFDGQCASNDAGQSFGEWWSDESSFGDGLRGLRAAISGTNCNASSCPEDELLVLVEDWDLNGPPSVGGDAFYIAMRVPIDAAGAGGSRRWDFALVDDPLNGGVSPTRLDLTQYPIVAQTSSTWNETKTAKILRYNLQDPGRGVHGIDAAGNLLPDDATIASIDICVFIGAADPGRLRDWWDCPDLPDYRLPYVPADILGGIIEVVCPNTVDDAFLSVGLTFEGGDGPDVPSVLVGRTIQIECDPNLADPQGLRARPPIRSRQNPTNGPSRRR